jgi:FkbM family methyltransferase
MDIYDFLKDNSDIKGVEVIIECGGHTGQDTIRLSNLFNNNMLHVIEANRFLFDTKLKLLNKANITAHNFGLSDKNEIKTFYLDSDPNGDAGASSFLRASATEGLSHLYKIEIPIDVECKTLDLFIKESKIEKIYLLWLDVEQFEYNILSACSKESLQNIKYIYTEVNFREFRSSGKLYNDIYSLMESNNFKEVLKTKQGSDSFDWQANVLFKNMSYE